MHLKKPLSLLLGALLLATGPWACASKTESPGPNAGTVPSRAPPTVDWRPIYERVEKLRAEGRTLELIDYAGRMVAKDPEQVGLYVVLAETFIGQEKHIKALRELNRALAHDATNRRALLLKARALRALGQDEKAAQAIRQLLAQAPNDVASWGELARIHRKAKAWGKLIPVMNRLIALEGSRAVHFVEKARAQINLKQMVAAQATLERAIERDGYHTQAHVMLATVWLARGLFLRAMEQTQILLKLDPEYERGARLFELTAYLEVNHRLDCAHGKPPYSQKQLQDVLNQFKTQGLTRTNYYHVLALRYGGDTRVKAQIAQAHALCPTQATVPSPADARPEAPNQ